jgi:hypothetical protein
LGKLILVPVIAAALVIGVGLYLAYGVRLTRSGTAEKVAALQSVEGRVIRLGVSVAYGLIAEEEGTLSRVGRKHVSLTALDGTTRSVGVENIRWIDDDRLGHRGDW